MDHARLHRPLWRGVLFTLLALTLLRPSPVAAQSASVDAPTGVTTGAEFTVTWSGPNNRGDFIAVYQAGETDNNRYTSYALTSNGNPARLRAPDLPAGQSGNYEVRYVSGQNRLTWASDPVTILPLATSVDAPAAVGAGAEFTVAWTGPNNRGDFIAIYPVGETSNNRYVSYALTSSGNPARVRAPDLPVGQAGSYEVRYVSGQSRLTWAADPIAVDPVSATVDAPNSITAGAQFTAAWSGPNNRGDFVALYRSGETDNNRYLSYALTSSGNPARLRAPDLAAGTIGTYEVRYVSGRDRFTWGSDALTVCAPGAASCPTPEPRPTVATSTPAPTATGAAATPTATRPAVTATPTAVGAATATSTPVPTRTAPALRFSPPRSTNTSSVHTVTSGSGVGTLRYRGQTPLEIDLPIGRYVGATDAQGKLTEASKLVGNRVLGGTAILQVAVWSSPGGPTAGLGAAARYVPPGDGGGITGPGEIGTEEPQREIARISVNGCPAKTISNLDDTWSVQQIAVPVDCLRFPTQRGAPSTPPAPMNNRVRVEIESSAATGQTWGVQVGWAAVRVTAVWPIAFLHGKGDAGYSWLKGDPTVCGAAPLALPIDPDPDPGSGGGGGGGSSGSSCDSALNLWGHPKSYFDDLGFLGEASAVSSTIPGTRSAPAGQVTLNNAPQGGIMDNARRLQAMLAQVKTVYGVEKVNIVAHSKGGLDARGYISRVAPAGEPDVANLVTLSTPHHGSTIATLPYVIAAVATKIVGPVGGLVALALLWNDLNDAQRDLMPAVTALFNLATPNRPGVNYFTVAADGGYITNDIPNPNAPTRPTDNRGGVIYGFGNDPSVRYSKGMDFGWWGWMINGVWDKDLLRLPPILFMPNDDLVTINNARLSGATHLGTVTENHFGAYQHEAPIRLAIGALQLRSGAQVQASSVRALADAPGIEPSGGRGPLEVYEGTLAAGAATAIPITVEGAEPAVFGAGSTGTGLALGLVDPAGTRSSETAPAPGVSFFPPDRGIGSGGTFGVAQAVTGTYQLELTNTSATALAFSAQALVPSVLDLRFATSPTMPRVGSSLIVTATLTDGATPLTGAAVTAVFSPTTGASATVPLLDDGTGGDAVAGDGTYTGASQATSPGALGIAVRATGVRASGAAFNRAGALAVTVLEAADRVTGAIAESAADADGNGLFDRLDATIGVQVAGGTYEIVGSLVSGDGKIVASDRVTATLAGGSGAVTLAFPGRDIFDAGRDGPYTIRNVTLSDLGAGRIGDVMEALTATQAYQAAQFEHDPIRPTGPLTSRGVDTGADSRFEALEVSLPIDVAVAGTYDWNAQLVAPDGTPIGVASGTAVFAVGPQVIRLNFPGGRIGSSGIDGRLDVRDLSIARREGNASLLIESAGLTDPLSAASFTAPLSRALLPLVSRAQPIGGW